MDEVERVGRVLTQRIVIRRAGPDPESKVLPRGEEPESLLHEKRRGCLE
jgi:hypothetical protein